MSKFIIRSSAANMPSSCWGTYRRIGVLEVEDGVEMVHAISEHAIGVIRVVATWEKLHVGSTDRCAYARAFREAEELVAELTAAQPEAAQ